MIKLSVNVNKVALLRNTRDINIPNVLKTAEIAVAAGAHGITVHPRPDQRHIRPSDVYGIAGFVAAHPGIELNIEGNPFPEFLELVRTVRPDQCTLVPDSPEQSTSDHGWGELQDFATLQSIIAELHSLGCRVSLFMDPVPEQFQRVKELGADRVELYTQPFAAAHAAGDFETVLRQYGDAAAAAQSLGLGVNAGHDLNLHNLPAFCAIPGIAEVSIGHALIADAIEMGLANTVRAYLAVLAKGQSSSGA